ncbi:MAG: trans-o-hydroxybenzylidenepyruvate hydratase-aldolase [Mycobacterium sp.]|jgi:dihydrodipicolinate synthase/N-acetylneuraminate lyase|nr:trans-o-hydroxybenzylidenepyruvate hydratase-aldolase [Mycobacterium sp.]
MLSARDVRGLLALPPTPCLEFTDWWDPEVNSVDLVEATRMARALVADGVGGIGLCGTTGECGALLWPEKAAYFGTVVDAVDGTVPVWCGTTALGTREVVRQMKAVRDLGGSGALVGLPMWQTPTPANAVRFYADLSEAVPDLPVLVYANSLFFKFDFGPQFWTQVCAQAPTVIAAKMGFVTAEHLEAVDGRVALLAGEGGALGAMYRLAPQAVTGAWATSAAMGPEPWVAFLDAHARGDVDAARCVIEDIESIPLPVPDFAAFAQYNAQMEKARINAAGYMNAGPCRAPYTDLPDDWVQAAESNGKAWAALRDKYRGSVK